MRDFRHDYEMDRIELEYRPAMQMRIGAVANSQFWLVPFQWAGHKLNWLAWMNGRSVSEPR